MISQNTVNKSVYVFLYSLLMINISHADDTDIYLDPAGASGSEPLVMFTLDYRSNLGSTVCPSFPPADTDTAIGNACGWDSSFISYFSSDDKTDGKFTLFEMLRAVLRKTMEPLDGVKVGLMMNHDNNCSGNPSSGPSKSGCSNGGYILSGFKLFESGDGNGNKDDFYDLLEDIPEPGGALSHNFQGKELYFELFRYLTGQGIYNGHLGYKDFGNTSSSGNLDTENSDIDWESSIESGTNYVSPLTGGLTCAKIFVVNIMFQVSQQEDNSDTAISESKANGGMNGLVLSGASNNFNTVINWMYNNDLADGTYGTAIDINGDQTVTSYFIEPSPSTTTNGYAYDGGTSAALTLDSDPAELEKTFKNLFSQILSVSTTFVSASVPVNVFNRSQVSENVYIALFEAEENAKPQWIGNVKKLKLLKDVSGSLYIGDANSAQAFAADGRINYSAETFWTNTSGADVVAADTSKNEISGSDGRSVNRGGAGQQTKGFLSGSPGTDNASAGARQLFTDPDSFTAGTATTLRALNADASTATALWNDINKDGEISSGTTLNATSWSAAPTYSASSAAEKVEAVDILKFTRGIDVMDQDGDTSTTDTRPWLMGDPIHSRPVPINYGATGSGYDMDNPDIRILVGSNDGYLRMYKNTKTDDSESGEEAWAFMPREVMPVLKRLKDNVAGTPVHPYGLDGAPTAYVLDANNDGAIKLVDSDKVILYFGLRRGGKAYYALDITIPDTPKILWKINSAQSDFSELALSFSTPRVALINYDTNVNVPVLIFGGGYDTNKDTRSSSTGTDDSSGNAIFIVDAMDGSLIWKAVQGTTGSISATKYQHVELVDSIPSDVTAVDTTNDRRVDRVYVGDTGGSIWRVNLTGTDRTNWTIAKFANLGRHYNSSKNRDRRFFHRPDFVRARDSTGPFDAVIIGSGDRANPLDKDVGSDEPVNWLFMLKDRGGATTNLQHSSLSNLTDNCFQEVDETCDASQVSELANGWKVKLDQEDGEKSLSTPLTLNGFVFFTTYIPPESGGSGCGPSEGEGLLYVMNLQDATAVINFNLGNTVVDDGVTYELQEEDRIRSTGSGIPAEAVALGDNYILPPGMNPIRVPAQTRWKTFWYINNQ